MVTPARFPVALAALGLASCCLVACAATENPTPENSGPQATTSTTERPDALVQRITYPVSDGGDPAQNWGDLYLPPGTHATAEVPLVVFLHGGAWMNTSGAEGADRIARDLADRGFAVYNVEYRRVDSGGGWPTTFTDVSAALDHVPELVDQYPELSMDDELIVGHSAGAQLAVWGSTRDNLDGHELGARPDFVPTRVVSLSGPLDLVWAAEHGDTRIETALDGTPEQVPERFDSVDPIQNIDPAVPVTAVHGDADTLVPKENSIHYIDALNKRNGTGRLELLEGEDHVSYLRADSPSYPVVLDIISRAGAQNPAAEREARASDSTSSAGI